MDTVVRNREVHYFNVLDVVDPEFKDILISECRQFHKELILEIKVINRPFASALFCWWR